VEIGIFQKSHSEEEGKEKVTPETIACLLALTILAIGLPSIYFYSKRMEK